jgi:filamentous hemagglutinin family protein
MSQKPISKKKYGLPIGLSKQQLLLAIIAMMAVLCPRASLAQVVGIDDTAVTRMGDQFEISGGSTIGPNQFFSFDRFSLDSAQTAVFQNRGGVDNVLAKVSGGLPSNISGQIRFLNNPSHFYLINPAGIVFGPTAQLDLKMAFTATTASAIGFGGDVWWDVKSGWSQPNVMDLGSPTALRFSPGTPGAIVNLGNIDVNDNLSLIGGTVLNTGNLIVPGGRINLATVAGNTVQLLSPSGLLRVELPSQAIPPLGFTPVSLPELITGAAPANANGIVINPDGTVMLTVNRDDEAPRNVSVKAGDIYTTTIGDKRVTTELPEQVILQSQGHLYGDQIHAYGGEGVAKIIGIAEQGIDLGHIHLRAAQDANQLYLANRLGTVSLKSSAGNVFAAFRLMLKDSFKRQVFCR